MKIAFASKDGEYVNEHFGWCETFYIYEIDEESFALVSEVDSSLKLEDEVDKLEYKISCLEDSDILCVQQIGPKAANMVKMAGIYPIKAQSEKDRIIDTIKSLQTLMRDNPPLWLKRITLRVED